MAIVWSVYFLFLVLFSFFTIKIIKQYHQAIKSGDITKEEIEKEREEMSIW